MRKAVDGQTHLRLNMVPELIEARARTDKCLARMLAQGLLETSWYLDLPANTPGDRQSLILLAHLRLGVLRAHFASSAARHYLHIAPAHAAGCPFCDASAEELSSGEDAAHHIVVCPTFQQARDSTGLQGVIDTLGATPEIQARPEVDRPKAILILAMGGHIKHNDAPVRATKWDPWPLARFLRATYREHRGRMAELHAAHTNTSPTPSSSTSPIDEDPYTGNLDLDEHVDDQAGLQPPDDEMVAEDDDEDDPTHLIDGDGEVLEFSEADLDILVAALGDEEGARMDLEMDGDPFDEDDRSASPPDAMDDDDDDDDDEGGESHDNSTYRRYKSNNQAAGGYSRREWGIQRAAQRAEGSSTR